MCAARLTELNTFANPQEIELLGILFSDHHITTALLEDNITMLSRVFNVSISTYEDTLKDRYEVVIRNYPSNFQIRALKHGVLECRDDVLGTIGTSVVARLRARDDSPRASAYLAGKRSKNSLLEMAKALDRPGLVMVADQIAELYPASRDTCRALSRWLTDKGMLGESLPDQDSPVGLLERWGGFLACIVTLYTFLRSSTARIEIKDHRPATNLVTVKEFLAARGTIDMSDVSFKPVEGSTFTPEERSMLTMMSPTLEIAEGLDGDQINVFRYISDEYFSHM